MHHLPSRYIPCDGRLTASTYFKSTLPVGGATPGSLRGTSQSGISIHAPRMGSDFMVFLYSFQNYISIHAPRMGSDKNVSACNPGKCISIHAPRMGSDKLIRPLEGDYLYFNPRSPHGERLNSPVHLSASRHFNPRSPHGERLLRFMPFSAFK